MKTATRTYALFRPSRFPLAHGRPRRRASRTATTLLLAALFVPLSAGSSVAGQLQAGAAKVDVTNRDARPGNDPLYVKALILKSDSITAAIITVDVVAIGQLGPIKNDFLPYVRSQLKKDLDIDPANVLVTASHCHGSVCADVAQRTVQAVKEAHNNLVPVRVGVGVGHEDRIMENRRLKLTNGREADVRHAYSLVPDEEVAGIGPVDPEIGVLRLDRNDGRTLAVVYNFACHPIQGVPSGGNTADMVGFASKVIEQNAGDGAIAVFLQGCAGDINPVVYKDVANPRDAEPLGNMLGLSTLEAFRKIKTQADADLRVIHETLELPRADLAPRIESMEAEQMKLVHSLKGTTLNLKTFIPLFVRYSAYPEHPSYASHRYMHDKLIGRDDLEKLDAENRRNMERYIANIHIMEELTRLQANLALLKMHHAQNVAAGKSTIDVEVSGLRVGDFFLVTFPGEPVVQVGLDIKAKSPHKPAFIAGYTNGYIYYAPTAEQLKNIGGAQEDSDCLLAPAWQQQFEDKALEILKKL